MLKLVHSPESRSSRLVWLLEELEQPYTIEYVTIPRRDGSGGPDPKNPHPDKKVPALVHDGALVTESVAIALYLTELFPAAGLAPRVGERGRGAYLTWLAYYAGVMEPVLVAEFAAVSDHPAFVATFRGRKEMNERISKALESAPYLAGDRFSAADIFVANVGQFMRGMLPQGEAVDAYIERCTSRAALTRAREKDSPPG